MAVWTIIKGFWMGTVRTYANLVYMLVMPVVFLLVFGVLPRIGGQVLPVAVVDDDHTVVSQAYIAALRQTEGVHVEVLADDAVGDTLRSFRAACIVTFPHGFQDAALSGKTPQVIWINSPNASADAQVRIQRLQERMQEWTLLGEAGVQQARHGHAAAPGTSGAAQWADAFAAGMQGAAHLTPAFVSRAVSTSGDDTASASLPQDQQTVIGVALIFIIFTVFGSTGMVLLHRNSGVWDRLLASPAPRWQVLAGYGVAFFSAGMIQFAILCLAGAVFGTPVPLNPLAIAVTTLYVLAICGIALCIAGLVKSAEQHMSIGTFVAVTTSMVGGAYWPLEIEPEWMQRLAWFVPQGWAVNGFKAALLGWGMTPETWLSMGVLAAIAVVFFTVGMVQLRYS
ncbi:MAG: ABC transporter permease [Alicyclobacillus macrosporangiidus]|uniref:ABC transporter permease n=1 Tax=Alicyclobacillus macrosporangiidus TaxID=392015 RepID=UPI0026EED1EE|nr:ABC transporter permease [Alicyclobacillus macrosporangiidus]MCL6599976.1 ABC transporter permease [Alicyclobacillus macrosporangiidus]